MNQRNKTHKISSKITITGIKYGSHQTAIKRKQPSSPLKKLLAMGVVKGRILDFGCGKGADLEHMTNDLDMWAEGYDPHWQPEEPAGLFDTVISTYVANVVPAEDEAAYLQHLREYLSRDGVAFVSVRRDVKKASWSKRGHQRPVFWDAPIVYQNSQWCTYKIDRFWLTWAWLHTSWNTGQPDQDQQPNQDHWDQFRAPAIAGKNT